ncbi:hypothetical protein CLV31_103221 [Algoriphagus aquaeductus]|jgi:uncharacterized protein YdaT|uniref:Uncharacterized protein n=1 Tax=Algoriphagus aquaeductus TaxID=475299 RepID=A0A326RUC5_9BACT|nr:MULTISPECIES: hypothetical protein [Algoriphagus]MBC6366672.1 hypothetical protein [Algoriphagus sp. AK58]PZV85429.1 hypothetical protein CLV31_103221 [Algoriphagus aquaeductus]
MEQISIPVKTQLAKAWENASDELKNEIAQLLEVQITQLLSSSEERKQVLKYFQSLQEDMKNKGLTQEILDDLLN